MYLTVSTHSPAHGHLKSFPISAQNRESCSQCSRARLSVRGWVLLWGAFLEAPWLVGAQVCTFKPIECHQIASWSSDPTSQDALSDTD